MTEHFNTVEVNDFNKNSLPHKYMLYWCCIFSPGWLGIDWVKEKKKTLSTVCCIAYDEQINWIFIHHILPALYGSKECNNQRMPKAAEVRLSQGWSRPGQQSVWQRDPVEPDGVFQSHQTSTRWWTENTGWIKYNIKKDNHFSITQISIWWLTAQLHLCSWSLNSGFACEIWPCDMFWWISERLFTQACMTEIHIVWLLLY